MTELIGITIAILGCIAMCMCLKYMIGIVWAKVKELEERVKKLEGKQP